MTSSISLLVAGVVVMVVTVLVFLALLPRDGRRHRFVETEWEPYIGVAFCSAVALSMTMMLSGVLSLLSSS